MGMGDEWLTIRHGIAFESMTLNPSIEDETFESLITRLLVATPARSAPTHAPISSWLPC
jgi:hypothetical protein